MIARAAGVASTACALFVAAGALQLAYPPTLNPADESFLLYAAKRLLQGDVLYRDIFDFQTPASFYYYALAFWLGGVSITSARVATVLVNATSCALTFVLARHVAGAAEATLAALAFVVLCVPAFSAASHHWLATMLALATAAVLLSSRWRESPRWRSASAGAVAGLAVCCQQGRALWLVAWLAVALPALVWARATEARIPRLVREAGWAAGGALVCVAILGHAAWRASVGELVYATYTWVITNYIPYNAGRTPWAGHVFWTRIGLANTEPWLLKQLPTLLIGETAWLAWSAWGGGLRPQIERACLLLLAGATAGSVLYYPDYIHVAFIAPFAFVVLAGMAWRLRALVVAGGRRGPALAFSAAWLVLFVLLIAKGEGNHRRLWQEAPVVFPTAFGQIGATAKRAHTVSDVRRMLAEYGGGASRLLSYPTDAALYLLVPADNPTPYALLRPRYNSEAQLAQAMDMLVREPRALVLVAGFLAQPNDPVYDFLRARYRLLRTSAPFEGGAVYYELWGQRDR